MDDQRTEQDGGINEPALAATKKHWLSFGLKTFLLVVTVLSVVVGHYVKSIRERRAGITAVQSLNGSISYKKHLPLWLRINVTDEKYFLSPVAVRFSPRHPIADDDLQAVIPHLKKMDDLTNVNLYQSHITDAGVAQLLPLADKLETLDIRRTYVSDSAIPYIQRFLSLKLLRVKDSAISADGIEKIRASLPSCKID